ncbi:MAG: CpaF family protein [Candidatus Altiarchaeales archaeon]|nr:MAG: CpaF family protein [Candidatus Altiarchaeales archaeon]RLI95167.1 MAG: CpaF family protein [Candidatus Altiarchaeales archaeon]RLI95437.1 MAG: CpaF family protein [Candidatus Altiarchaeales archaeon]HDO82114.1 CpaF family protein [Candidatus Altiarchaeales archaeon]HEX54763.1 CpaF family protein [Candidatus Altiarchaeales archaeon]
MLYQYNVKIPELGDSEKKLLRSLENKFLMKYSARLSHLNRRDREVLAKEFLVNELSKMGIVISSEDINKYLQYTSGYGLIDPLVNDDEVEEIFINGWRSPVMIYHRKFGKCKTNLIFENENELDRLIDKIVIFCGFARKKPILDSVLPDGPRINLTLPPVSYDRSVITIRKYLRNPPSIAELIINGTMSPDIGALIWICVDGFGLAPRNILIAGGTSSGKTTLLNAILPFCREHERIVSIEDTLELDLSYCEDWVRTNTTEYADMEKLIENSLRLRPDRIIVGEVRGREAYNLINAMNLGHTGMGTIHSDSSRDAILKLTSPPMNVDPKMLAVLDMIIVMTRFHEGKACRRLVTHIDEVGNVIGGQVQLGSVYKYNAKTKKTEFSRFPAVTINKIADIVGITPKDVIAEIKRREILLEYMTAKGIVKESEFVKFIRKYYENPASVFKRAIDEMKTIEKKEHEKPMEAK